jgi:hypothetical protein
MFTGRATPTEETKSKKIVARGRRSRGEFGIVKVVPRARDVLILQTDLWAVPTWRAARW